MGAKHPPIELSLAEIRAVSTFALRCAERVLPLFLEAYPDDPRPASAIVAGRAFVDGGPRDTNLRRVAMAAWRAGREATDAGHGRAGQAAFSASSAGAAAFLHPFAEAHQVKHILGAGAHAVCALELGAAEGPDWVDSVADAAVRRVLRRMPPAPSAGGTVGAVVRRLDVRLRASGGAESAQKYPDPGA